MGEGFPAVSTPCSRSQRSLGGKELGKAASHIPLSWAEVPAIEGMRMHLLEETTVRTEWTRAPGNVDAYEIQFIPTVRAKLQEGAE